MDKNSSAQTLTIYHALFYALAAGFAAYAICGQGGMCLVRIRTQVGVQPVSVRLGASFALSIAVLAEINAILPTVRAVWKGIISS